MLYLKAFIFLEILVLYLVSLRRNGDIFSPAKIFLAYSFFFYASIFINEVLWETLICYFFIIQFIGIVIYLEKRNSMLPLSQDKPNIAFFYQFIWLLSLPGILTMAYFIYSAGGVSEHLASLQYRVSEWKGRGILVIFLNMLPTLVLLYFAGILSHKNKKLSSKITFMFLFIIVFVVGLMTGSRSYIAMPILGGVFVWSYFIKPLMLRKVILIIGLLALFVSVMGALRNSNYSSDATSDLVQNGLVVNNLELTHFSYGVNPLQHIFSSDEKVFLGGMTYLSIFTNIIPRSLWADKPDTGGVIFTRLYTDDDTGLSFIATGAIAEAVLNFGKLFGVVFGLLTILFVFYLGCVLYNRWVVLASRKVKPISAFKLVAYFYIVLTFARYSYGEFTNIFQSLIFFNLIPIGLVYIGSSFFVKKYWK